MLPSCAQIGITVEPSGSRLFDVRRLVSIISLITYLQEGESFHNMKEASRGTNAPLCLGISRGV
jgi:hypothetical protein